VGTRSTWPEVKESIQDGGSLFSKDDPSGKEGESKLFFINGHIQYFPCNLKQECHYKSKKNDFECGTGFFLVKITKRDLFCSALR
jgi:hypothetical protein